MFAKTSRARQVLADTAKAKKDALSTLSSSSESDLDSDDKNSVPVAATGAAAATLSDDDYVDESGDDSDGNSVKSGSRRWQRQRRAGKAHTSEELLSEAADDAPEDSGSESDDNDRPPRSAAEVQRAFAVWLKANYRLGQRRTCAVCGEWSFWGEFPSTTYTLKDFNPVDGQCGRSGGNHAAVL